MSAELTSAIARIRQANGRVVGAGFLVSDKYILTCSHVINVALGRQINAPDEPHQEVCLDFPLVTSRKMFRGRVVRWISVQPSSSILPETGADIALLELESPLPEKAQPVRLVQAENLWKHPFQIFGFPEGQAVGVWTDGIISNPQANGRVQIEVIRTTAYPIEPGFSGSPVWDEQLDGVVGMTVAIDSRRSEVRAAFIIPTTQLVNACPELKEQVIDRPILEVGGYNSANNSNKEISSGINLLIKIKQNFRDNLYKQLEAAYERLGQVTGAESARVQTEIDGLELKINKINQEISNT
ncbi:MAG: trypsin-like peptidase domain-containing protein [Symploca sp. SIO2E6]|nr:trypsin-like peptidase domain-containing protein [Symploca sp. SIO2E6]